MKNKILYILPSKDIGGTEKMVVMLATKISDYGYQPIILTLQGKGPFHKLLEIYHIKHHILNIKKRPLCTIFKTFFFVILKEKPCLLHGFLFAGNVFAGLLRFFFWRPLVCSQRSTDVWKKLIHWRIEKFATIFCSAFISNSNAGKKILIEKAHIPEKKIIVIPNGIDLAEVEKKLRNATGISHAGIYVGAVGNLRKAKGYEILIDAAALVCKKRKDIRFIILGKGPLEHQLKRKIQHLHLMQNFEFHGFVEDVYNYILTFDIVVIPSLWEGFPVIALEAMACGKPIIATKVGDLPEILQHRISGLLVEPGNPQDLANSILMLAADHNMRIQMGNNAKNQVEKFSATDMVKKYSEIYNRLIVKNETKITTKTS
ncbi:MAG: glycosyltransferase [Candidatus Ratteibacteria bacterium]